MWPSIAFCLKGTPQLPGNWDRQLGIERDVPGNVPGDVRDLGGCGSPLFGGVVCPAGNPEVRLHSALYAHLSCGPGNSAWKATCQATALWAPEGDGCGRWWKAVAKEIARSLGSDLAHARQLFYGPPKATCQATRQATLGILAGRGSPVFDVELDGGKLRRGNCFMGSRRQRARRRARRR